MNSSANNKFEAILQTSTDLNLILDPHGVILDYKSSSPSLPLDFSESLLQQNVRDIFSSDLAGKLEEALHSVQQTGEVVSLEYPLTALNQEYWFDARLIPLSQSQIMFSARDTTKCREIESKLERQVQQFSALRSIDLAIASGLDLNLLLSMLLERVMMLMQVDAAAILLLNSKTNILEFASGKGFHSNTLQYTHLRMGEGCAGRVALERRPIHVPDLRKDNMEFGRSPLFRKENFLVYWGTPLMAKGQVLGVLEMFHRSSLEPDADWRNFLSMIAGQAAIAIDSAMMFNELQRSNVELSMAYDATIEGLSRTLDLRDKETKEHTFRVADMTMKLAARLKVNEPDLIHIRRGAILHDIGKLAIPDQILFKPGPLADDEWQIMRRHPDIAVELLSPVSYLEPALAIPHWHHEKWDGSGYPDGLRREDIPFAARMFAVVDVYDALTSDRPYRAAWPNGDAIQYIQNQSGTHFDPNIVPEFLQMVNRSGY